MHYLKLKKRYDIRSCPRCARGKMFDMHLHSQKIENGLYVCNHCGHYHKKYSMNNVIIGFVFIMITVSLGDMNHLGIRLVILLFIYIIFRELKKYFLFNSSYPILKYFGGRFEPTDAQLDGVESYENKQSFSFIASIFFIPYLPE